MRSIFSILISLVSLTPTLSQGKGNDTRVVVPLTTSTDVTIDMRDRNDIEVLKHYDFQALFQDVIHRLETADTSSSAMPATMQIAPAPPTIATAAASDTTRQADSIPANSSTPPTSSTYSDSHEWETLNGNTGSSHDWHDHSVERFRTWPYFNVELGTNNYLSNGKFPDNENALYSVRPIGSWSFSANSIERTKVAGKFFLEWGMGLSWYNFKFQDNSVRLMPDDTGVNISTDDSDFTFKKSKLTASYLNVSFVPVIDFSGEGHRSRFWDDGHSFRFGIGGYAGYRLGGHTKTLYKDEGDRKKDKNSDNLYLSNIRYGLRLQLGFRSTDVFFNYDLNSLFVSGKGPSLNAFSFGITL